MNLQKLPRWRYYKKLRRAARIELDGAGKYYGEHSIDMHLRQNFNDVLRDVKLCFEADLKARGWR